METNTTMTDQHPLTDEICEELSSCITILKSGDVDPYISPFDVECDMRAGADWQLQKVNDFFDNYRKTVTEMNPGYIPSLTELLSLMNQAMRPTTTQEDN